MRPPEKTSNDLFFLSLSKIDDKQIAAEIKNKKNNVMSYKSIKEQVLFNHQELIEYAIEKSLDRFIEIILNEFPKQKQELINYIEKHEPIKQLVFSGMDRTLALIIKNKPENAQEALEYKSFFEKKGLERVENLLSDRVKPEKYKYQSPFAEQKIKTSTEDVSLNIQKFM